MLSTQSRSKETVFASHIGPDSNLVLHSARWSNHAVARNERIVMKKLFAGAVAVFFGALSQSRLDNAQPCARADEYVFTPASSLSLAERSTLRSSRTAPSRRTGPALRRRMV